MSACLAMAAETSPATAETAAAPKTVTITSRTMEADNRAHTAVFTGDVVADMDGTVIHSEQMEVFYSGESGQVERIVCTGGVKVIKESRVILSDRATYFGDEEKIAFQGDPRIMEGENLVTGSTIVYFPNADRLIVEDSRVYMQSQ